MRSAAACSFANAGRSPAAARPAPVEGVWREIVGVVADLRQGNLDEAPAMTIYRPYTQIVEHDMMLMVRAPVAQAFGWRA